MWKNFHQKKLEQNSSFDAMIFIIFFMINYLLSVVTRNQNNKSTWKIDNTMKSHTHIQSYRHFIIIATKFTVFHYNMSYFWTFLSSHYIRNCKLVTKYIIRAYNRWCNFFVYYISKHSIFAILFSFRLKRYSYYCGYSLLETFHSDSISIFSEKTWIVPSFLSFSLKR